MPILDQYGNALDLTNGYRTFAGLNVSLVDLVALAVAQNTMGNQEAHPLINSSFGWYQGRVWAGAFTPGPSPSPYSQPANTPFTSGTPWWVVFPNADVYTTSNCVAAAASRIHIRNFKFWLHRASTNLWETPFVITPSMIYAGMYGYNFEENYGAPTHTVYTATDAVFDSPGTVTGYATSTCVLHGFTSRWLVDDDRNYDAVASQLDVMSEHASNQYVIDLGADWWINQSAGFLQNQYGQVNNPGVFLNNAFKIPTGGVWRTMYGFSCSPAQFQTSHPPLT